MTQAELMTKWPREQFDVWKSTGFFADTVSYEEYLEMKKSQMELARQQKIELFGEDLDEVPYEEPPELLAAEEASERVWGDKKPSAEKKKFSSASAA